MGEGDTWLNAIVGGVVAVVLSPVLNVFAAALGGGVAGFLNRGDVTDGAVVGTLSGILGGLLSVVVSLAFLVVVGGALFGGIAAGPAPAPGPPDVAGVFGPVIVAFVVFSLLAFVVLGAIGGAVGTYIAKEV